VQVFRAFVDSGILKSKAFHAKTKRTQRKVKGIVQDCAALLAFHFTY
jgi:hypothetical protein